MLREVRLQFATFANSLVDSWTVQVVTLMNLNVPGVVQCEDLDDVAVAAFSKCNGKGEQHVATGHAEPGQQ